MTSYLHPYISKFDSSISNDYLNNYILAIQYSLDGFCFVVYSPENQKFIGLEHFTINDKEANLKSILAEFQTLKNWNLENFAKVFILIDNRSNIFIPAILYENAYKSEYMSFLNLSHNSQIFSDYLLHAESFNVYTISDKEEINIKELPENYKIVNASSVLIESLIKDYFERTPEARIFINVKNNYFELSVLKGCILLLNNNFNFKTKEDFLYFLLFSIEQLHLDSETVPVYFLGLIDEKSKIVELCSRYVKDIRFIKRNNNLRYTKELNDIPYYYHYCLYNTPLCEL